MKRMRLTKIIASSLMVASVLALNPIGASAEWRQDSTGWWYSEGSSWATGWRQLNGKWYYFNTSGYMAHDTVIGEYKIGSDGAWIQDTASTVNKSVSSVKPTQDKVKSTGNYSWFEENGNKYFKLDNNQYATGWIKIDLGTYYFNQDGVLQTGTFTIDGITYTSKTVGDAKHGTFESIPNAPLTINTAVSTGTYKDGYDPIKFSTPTDPTVQVYDLENTLKDIGSRVFDINMKATNEKVKYDNNTKTLTIKKGRVVDLGAFELRSPTEKYQAPAFVAQINSTNSDIVGTGAELGFLDGYVNALGAKVVSKQTGESQVTITANNFSITFNVIVTD